MGVRGDGPVPWSGARGVRFYSARALGTRVSNGGFLALGPGAWGLRSLGAWASGSVGSWWLGVFLRVLGAVLVGGLAAGALWVSGVPVGVWGFCGGSWGRLGALSGAWGLSGLVCLSLRSEEHTS